MYVMLIIELLLVKDMNNPDWLRNFSAPICCRFVGVPMVSSGSLMITIIAHTLSLWRSSACQQLIINLSPTRKPCRSDTVGKGRVRIENAPLMTLRTVKDPKVSALWDWMAPGFVRWFNAWSRTINENLVFGSPTQRHPSAFLVVGPATTSNWLHSVE